MGGGFPFDVPRLPDPRWLLDLIRTLQALANASELLKYVLRMAPDLVTAATQPPPSPAPAEARKHVGSADWSYSANRPPYAPGTNKCNLFVYEVLNNAGMPVPMKRRWSWRKYLSSPPDGYVDYPPLAGQWADPDVDIPGWVVVQDPQPGDVAAMKMDYSDASGHVGIVVAPGTTVSASAGEDMIVENDWGFREDQKDKMVFRRYVGIPK